MNKILIVEDDTNINNLLKEAITKEGYACEQAFSGTEAGMLLQMNNYALVLLDLMLPGIPGEEVLARIRVKGNLPVIVLTAKDDLDDKISLLTEGPDDYITKPFEIKEVVARIQVQMRHASCQEPESSILYYRELTLNRDTYEVCVAGQVISNRIFFGYLEWGNVKEFLQYFGVQVVLNFTLVIIQERIGSLKDMLEELFTFTKLKNESYHLELSSCCVNRILKDTVFSYYEDWMRHGIEPELNITDKLLYIEGNAQGLRRAVQNIIKNALDHGEKNIKVSLYEERGRVILRICNKVQNYYNDEG